MKNEKKFGEYKKVKVGSVIKYTWRGSLKVGVVDEIEPGVFYTEANGQPNGLGDGVPFGNVRKVLVS